jgi:hypothetical protein
MAEGRFLSKSIATSGQLKRVSLEADYLFTRCIPHLDREGRLDGDPDVVKAMACPLRSELTPEMIAVCLGELDTVGLIVWYEVDGQQIVYFPGFKDHQRGMKPERERPSRYPSHESQGAKPARRTAPGVVPDLAGRTPPSSKTNSPQVKSSKGKLREVKLSEDTAADSGESGVVRGGWPAEAASLWGAKVAPLTIGRISGPLKPIVDVHGWEKTKAGMEAYIVGTPDGRWNLQAFANNANYWIGIGFGARRTPEGKLSMTDEFGEYTPLGKLVLAQ